MFNKKFVKLVQTVIHGMLKIVIHGMLAIVIHGMLAIVIHGMLAIVIHGMLAIVVHFLEVTARPGTMLIHAPSGLVATVLATVVIVQNLTPPPEVIALLSPEVLALLSAEVIALLLIKDHA